MNLHDKPEAGCRSTATFAALLVQHRKRDGRSQLALSLDIGISSRHLGFLETGRAQPSPQMVARLVEAFALGPIESSQMSLAAGQAPPASMQPEAASVLATALGIAAFDAGIAIAGADTIEDAQRTAARFLLSLGVEHHMTGTLRRGPAGWEIERDPGGNPAVGWLRHNELNGYRDQDYLVRATASANRAFFWSDARRERLSQVERRILDEAEDFRITNGFVMPLHMSDGSVRALSSWAQKIDTDNVTRLALGLVASVLIERIVALDTPPLPPNEPVRLETRHREILGFVAGGHSAAAIGQRLALTDEEVSQRLGDAATSMGCATPASAACRAAALELL